ncbi:MAG: tRNA dihydrouridine synthase DusB [Clostridia bacterium]|nr:tRNA dihydrouridine synthase DusB [Clostridia bacterium]
MSLNLLFDKGLPVLLAPMAGITDMPFRELCIMHGADMTYTEMISAKGLFFGDKKTRRLVIPSDIEKKFAIQLFGSEPRVMADMARALSYEYGDRLLLIDINMGCPAPKITSNGEGSSLMKDPKLAALIVETVASAVNIPVTVKQRTGWDDTSKNGKEFAKLMENSGAAMITVHGRTRAQMYSGMADMDMIRDIKAAAKIPIIGNGDIRDGDSALRMKNETGCDGIMVARGAMGNPFIFAEIKARLAGENYTPPTDEERIKTALIHAKRHIEVKGEGAFVELRKHMAWYTHGMRGANAMRVALNAVSTYDELERLLTGCFLM